MNDPRRVDLYGRITVIVMALAFTGLIFQQAVRPLLSARENMADFRNAVQILTDAEGSVERLDNEIRFVAEEIEQSKMLLPKTVNLDAFLEYIGDLAVITETRIEKLTPRDAEDRELYRELPLDVRIAGPFPAIYDFLVRLEGGDRLCRVEQMKIDTRDEGKSCQAEMVLGLFFARDGGDI